jgi:hypothetical protein
LKAAPGRTYSGLAATWGKDFRIGDVPFHAILSVNHIAAVSFLYHAMALTSDLMVWFDENNPAHYRLFNISTVIAPVTHPVAPFLKPSATSGDFQIYSGPANGYFDVVNVPYSVPVFPEDFYDVNLRWMRSNWVSGQNHLLLDTDEKDGSGIPRLHSGQELPELRPAVDLGFIANERRNGETYEANTDVQRPAYLLFKMTFHPNWHAVIDGVSQSPVMLSPGFMGVPLNPGRHHIRFEYTSGYLKSLLLVFGAILVAGVLVVERNGGLERLDSVIDRGSKLIHDSRNGREPGLAFTMAGLVVLAVPVCFPLLTSQLVSGHDAFVYVPRLVEFHENIRNGVLLPRWAPDLGNGNGQPLFLFTPPLIYYLAEIWYALGVQATTAYNIASVIIVLASALFMFLLGQLYFGRAGGWVAAVAYVYAPYFHIDLYVRQALAEFAAFPFYPLTLYGFGRFVRDRDRKFLLIGACGFAGIVLAHNAAALLFAPVLFAFILVNAWSARSWKLLLRLLGGVALALMLSAFVWLPILMEMKHVHIDRLREGYLSYSNHFVYPWQFLSASWGFGLSVPGSADDMSFSLGWPQALMLAAAIVLTKRQSLENRRVVALFATLTVIYCVTMTPAAIWLWDHARLLQQTQFPWRMLGPVSVCVAVVVASLTRIWSGTAPKGGFALALASLVSLNLGHIGAERYYRLASQDWTPDQIAQRGVSVTTGEEYEPRAVLVRPPYQAERFRVLAGDAKIVGQVRKPNYWMAQIHSSRDSIVQASLFSFPGWTASIDDIEVPIQSEATGLIQTSIPAGEHRLKLELRRTTPRFLGEIITGIGVVVAATVLL